MAHGQVIFITCTRNWYRMADTITCSSCGNVAGSAADLEVKTEVPAVETSEDGSINLYENHDLFLCSNCRKPLGISRPKP